MKKKQMLLWFGALIVGVAIGLIDISRVNELMNFIATVFTRLFRLLAVPTIVLAIVTTMSSLGGGRKVGRMFRVTVTYTLLTTVTAAAIGLGLYLLIAPENMPAGGVAGSAPVEMAGEADAFSYTDHILSVVPDNVVRPLLDGNVLALLLISFAVGIALSKMPASAARDVVVNGINGLQELLFVLIRWLILILPVGIVAFAAQMVTTVSGGAMLDSLGRYVAVVIGANCLQFAVALPLFLLSRGINPLKAIRGMAPAVMMAVFTKSSAATLPVTMANAEERMGVDKRVSRFVLPICTTVNMNGCATFILVTSLYVMQNNGLELTVSTMIVWLLISVLSAVGNAGVPMGCYFLTLSLMSGIGVDISIMGVILPIYTVIDMIETGENVWSDSCVCMMTDRVMNQSLSHKKC